MAGALEEVVLRRSRMRRPRGLGTNIPGAAQRGPPDPSAPRPCVAPTGRWRPRARQSPRPSTLCFMPGARALSDLMGSYPISVMPATSSSLVLSPWFTNLPPVPQPMSPREPSWVEPIVG